MELQETYAVTGPQLQILGEAESRLPAPVRKKPSAAAFLAVMMLVAVFGINGLKLKDQYDKTVRLYTDENEGYSIAYLLDQSADYAANMLTVAQSVLPAGDPVLQAAQQAQQRLQAAGTPAEQYAAESELVSRLKALYETAHPLLEGSRADSFRAQYQEALSAWEQTGHMQYNTAADRYNQQASAFPANLIAGLWGIDQVGRYAPVDRGMG